MRRENTEVEAREGQVDPRDNWKEQVGTCIPGELVLESCCVGKEQAQTFQDIWNTK